jgi:hypothetical protein
LVNCGKFSDWRTIWIADEHRLLNLFRKSPAKFAAQEKQSWALPAARESSQRFAQAKSRASSID